mmetsp:Transcript_3303/g.10359  ORF Transcript_3303/g.10359 Transcript_3303/m.10359 type:complete len:240 (+) Transcript_3303:1703-2422(+)
MAPQARPPPHPPCRRCHPRRRCAGCRAATRHRRRVGYLRRLSWPRLLLLPLPLPLPLRRHPMVVVMDSLSPPLARTSDLSQLALPFWLPLPALVAPRLCQRTAQSRCPRHFAALTAIHGTPRTGHWAQSWRSARGMSQAPAAPVPTPAFQGQELRATQQRQLRLQRGWHQRLQSRVVQTATTTMVAMRTQTPNSNGNRHARRPCWTLSRPVNLQCLAPPVPPRRRSRWSLCPCAGAPRA